MLASNTSGYIDVFSVDHHVPRCPTVSLIYEYLLCRAKLTAKLLYHLSLKLAQDDMDLAYSQAYWPCSNM